MKTTQIFLETLFPDLNGAFIEARYIKGPDVRQYFCNNVASFLHDVPKTLEEQNGYNVHFGVCPRSKRDGHKEAIWSVPCLWVDIDFKPFPTGEPEALTRLQTFLIPPTIVVHSGHGLHCYWVLREPETIESPSDVARIEAHLKALAQALGGDPHAAELAHLLRLPGTYNLKDPNAPVLTTIIECDPSCQVNLGDFETILTLPVAQPATNPPGWITEALTNLSDGNRNATFAKIIGRLHREGWLPDDIVALLHPHAEQHHFSQEELRREVEGICRRYPSGNSSESPAHGASDWPAPLEEAAHYGLAGEIVRTIEPHSEADPVALLVQLLVAFGNVIGHTPHFTVEATRHPLNLFVVLTGATSKGRKGSSWGHVQRMCTGVDREWGSQRLQSGLSSGEGLIWAVRDPSTNGSGVDDKRLLVLEPEFASTLHVMRREGNTLSPTIRQAWDSGDLRVLTKNNPAQATGAHISIIGHITRDELLRHLDSTEAGNGFGNRFLWVCVRRSKCLPEGGQIHEVEFAPLMERLTKAVEHAKTVEEIKRDEAAKQLWYEMYPQLSEGHLGLFGAVTSRAEAQVMRLACLYALLDRSSIVQAEHLQAALALWRYCEASARYIFGSRVGDSVADEILKALHSHPEGITRTDIRDLFGRNRKSNEIERALTLLAERSLARMTPEQTGGRTAERWFAT